MNVQLSPYFIFEDGFLSGLSTLDGGDYSFTSFQQERLLDLKSVGQSPLTAPDLQLIEIGAVIPTDKLDLIRDSLLVAISETLNSTASLIVMPTEKCNFRCSYCYETFIRGRMSGSTISSVKSYITKSVPRFKQYQLAWFGGEPMLHPDIIAEVTSHFTETLKASGTQGTASVTTNGYLLKSESLEKLTAAGLSIYHITLDGPKEVHDSQRVAVRGRSTYDRILRNLKLILLESDAKIILRINVYLKDESSTRKIKDWLTQEILVEFDQFRDRLDFYTVPVWDATTTSIDGICLTNLLDFQRFAQLREMVSNVKGSSLRKELSRNFEKFGTLSCYAGSPNSFVIGSDGAVYKCTVALDLPANRVGALTSDGSLDLNEGTAALWTNGNAVTDTTCRGCNFAKACQGIFCPLIRLQTRRPPCPTEKRFAGEIVNHRY